LKKKDSSPQRFAFGKLTFGHFCEAKAPRLRMTEFICIRMT